MKGAPETSAGATTRAARTSATRIKSIVFPEWVVYIYYDITVPNIIIDYLKKMDNVELKFINKRSFSYPFPISHFLIFQEQADNQSKL